MQGKEVLYDIHVPIVNNYLANNIWSHNCGVGKTVGMYAWALAKCGRDEQGNVAAPVLIVSPGDLHRQTAIDGKKFFGVETHGDPNVDLHANMPPGFYIRSYEWLEGWTVPPDAFTCVMVDEGDRTKKTRTAAGQCVRALKPKYRLIATATPLADRLQDLFWLCSWVCENDPPDARRFPYSPSQVEYRRFADRFIADGRNLTTDAAEQSTEVSQLLLLWRWLSAIILRRKLEDTGEKIVGLNHEIVTVPMGESQYQRYSHALLGDWRGTGEMLSLLRQIAGGNEWPCPKTLKALDLICGALERREQIYVASDFRDANDIVSAGLTMAGVPHVLMDGRSSPQKRAKMAGNFKAQDVPVALLGMRSAAEGHSYPRCNNAVILNYSWEQKKLPQMIGRGRRINSEKDLNVWSIVTQGTIEQRMVKLVIDDKGSAADLVLDGEWPGIEPSISQAGWIEASAEAWQDASIAVPVNEMYAQWEHLRMRLSLAYEIWKGSGGIGFSSSKTINTWKYLNHLADGGAHGIQIETDAKE
jgi:SNF2 family DNA or RNA helicase